MEYMILIYGDEKAWAGLNERELKEAYAGYMSYTKELGEAGAMRCGKVTTTDGPFAETKEQLGGYYIVEAPNLDEAISWAAKCPGARLGACEVRPLKKN